MSYTELEFGAAGVAGLPRLVFILDEAAGIPPALADGDQGAVTGFRRRLLAGELIARRFTSSAELELEVFHALTEARRGGLLAGVKADRVTFEAAARGRDSERSAGTVAVSDVSPVAAIRTLPRDVASFTGRERELAQLIRDGVAASSGGVVGICAIGGMPGIGKTAFAVHAAHLLAARFPDGQIYMPLHGHTPGQRPADPADALASLLQTTGVDAQHIPADLDGRTRMWRDWLAGRRVLLLLDDASGHGQVRPLLPGSAGCLVLVTSRRHLTALEDARLISLDVLPCGDAADLLTRLADRPGLDPADPAVQQITDLCGYLPLAIGMLARQLHHHPVWSPAGLAETLAAGRDRLALITAENLSVAAAFDLSYRDLEPGQQLLFRRLSLHPGPDFDAYAATALAGSSLDATRAGIAGLYDHYLVAEPARGRYRSHDLLAEHARTLAATDPADERDQALSRLFSYYLHTTANAGWHLARRTPAADPTVTVGHTPVFPGLTTPASQVAWLDDERVNLYAAITRAAADHPGYAAAIAEAMHAYLRHHGPWDQALALHRLALEAARLLGDRNAEAGALTDVGDIEHLAGGYPAAEASLAQAITTYRALGNQLGEANASAILGRVEFMTGNTSMAAARLTNAISVFQALGDRLGEAGALAYLSQVQTANGDHLAAIAGLTRAVELTSHLGNLVRKAGMLNFLGVAQHAAGEHAAAVASQQRSLDLYRNIGNPLGTAHATRDLGVAQLGAGDYLAAAASLSRALPLHRELGRLIGEASTRRHLAAVRRLTSHDDEAVSRELADVLSLYRNLGHRLGEAEVLNDIGDLSLASGRHNEARKNYEQALAIATTVAAPLEQARAHDGIGRCKLPEDQPAAASSLRQALAIYQRIGSPKARQVQALLNESGQTGRGRRHRAAPHRGTGSRPARG